MADLWIREQNGCGLLKVDNVICCRTRIFTNKSDTGITIDLGKYDTEERAGEVLDEIQKLLMQPTAFLKADIPQGMSFEDANKYVEQINEFCGQNNLLYVGSKNCEIIPTNNTNIVFTMPEE